MMTSGPSPTKYGPHRLIIANYEKKSTAFFHYNHLICIFYACALKPVDGWNNRVTGKVVELHSRLKNACNKGVQGVPTTATIAVHVKLSAELS